MPDPVWLTRAVAIALVGLAALPGCYAVTEDPIKAPYYLTLRNSLIVVITIIGLQLGGLISGAVVTEILDQPPDPGRR